MIEGPAGVIAFGFVPAYERAGFYAPEEIHSKLGQGGVDFDGDLISVVSDRYRLFASNPTCVCCGRTGTVYAKERSAKFRKATQTYSATTDTWHFNLYAVEGTKLILMTKDHIIPRARGGANFITNYQTMCSPCNVKKGHRIDGEAPTDYHASNVQIEARRRKAEAAGLREARAERERLKEMGLIVNA